MSPARDGHFPGSGGTVVVVAFVDPSGPVVVVSGAVVVVVVSGVVVVVIIPVVVVVVSGVVVVVVSGIVVVVVAVPVAVVVVVFAFVDPSGVVVVVDPSGKGHSFAPMLLSSSTVTLSVGVTDQ